MSCAEGLALPLQDFYVVSTLILILKCKNLTEIHSDASRRYKISANVKCHKTKHKISFEEQRNVPWATRSDLIGRNCKRQSFYKLFGLISETKTDMILLSKRRMAKTQARNMLLAGAVGRCAYDRTGNIRAISTSPEDK